MTKKKPQLEKLLKHGTEGRVNDMRLIDADAKGLQQRININFGSVTRFIVKSILKDAPTIDAVPVVRCKDCYLHGECMTEDAFHWSGIQNPYCAAGKKAGE
jgi:hypothetical protein